MTTTKWLRRTLMGGAALGLLAGTAQADDLAALKLELARLKTQVDTLETRHPALPPDASFMTVRKGQGQLSGWAFLRDNGIDPSQGYSFAVSPAADMPTPTSEITVAGTIRAQILYRDYDSVFVNAEPLLDDDDQIIGYDPIDVVRLKGKGDTDVYSDNNRLSIAGRTDTAVGQIRGALLFDMDNAFGNAALKKAWGEWDLTPGWILAGGVNAGTSSLEYSPDWQLSVIDVISATGGPTNSTIEQVRMTYTAGPLTWAIAVENSSNGDFTAAGEGDGGANLPDFASRINYAGTGFAFDVAGAVADDNGHDTDWTIGASAQVSLAQNTTLLLAGNYARGYYRNFYKSAGGTSVNSIADTFSIASLHDYAPDGRAWSAAAGLTFGLTDNTNLNLAAGYTRFDLDDFDAGDPLDAEVALTHALVNIIYTPVTQFSVGVEVDWARGDMELAGLGVETGGDDAASFGAGIGMWWRF